MNTRSINYTSKLLYAFLLCLFILYGIFLGLRFGSLELSISLAQKSIAPFLFVLIAFFLIKYFYVPSALFIVTAFLAVTGVLVGFSFVVQTDRNVLVPKFANDELETASRMFREALREQLSTDLNFKIKRFHKNLNRQSASELLKDNPQVPALVLGNDKKLQIFFQEVKPQALGEFVGMSSDIWSLLASDQRTTLSKLRLISILPEIDLSRMPEVASIRFVADLLSGVVAGYFHNLASETMPDARVQDLEIAALRGAEWRGSFRHRAFAAFILGNYYLRQAFINGFQPAYIDCAAARYRLAAGFLKPEGDYPLYAAVYNNMGVLRAVQAFVLEVPETERKARDNFTRVQNDLGKFNQHSDKKKPSSLMAYKAASKNLAKMTVLRGTKQQTGIKRRNLKK